MWSTFRRCIRLVALGLAAAPVAAQTPAFETTRVADGVYRFRWQQHNALFVVTPAGVVAFDPISAQAAGTYATEIRRVAPGAALRAIVYSHSDADHATGAAALMRGMNQQNVPIIAHERAVEPIRRANDPELPIPTVTFADRLVTDFGGRTLELHAVGPSHTDNMLVGFVPDAGVVFAVDFVSHDRVGFQELPGYHVPEYFDAVRRLLDLPFTSVVFGHGPNGDRGSVQRQFVYYDDLRAAVRRAIAQGLTAEQAATQVRLPQYASWGQYDAWFPLNVRGMYRLLTAGRE